MQRSAGKTSCQASKTRVARLDSERIQGRSFRCCPWGRRVAWPPLTGATSEAHSNAFHLAQVARRHRGPIVPVPRLGAYGLPLIAILTTSSAEAWGSATQRAVCSDPFSCPQLRVATPRPGLCRGPQRQSRDTNHTA